jgi:hypothetical protein
MPIPRDGPHRGIDCKFDFFSEFEFIFEKALGYESGGWAKCFDEKKTGKISRVSVPLSGPKEKVFTYITKYPLGFKYSLFLKYCTVLYSNIENKIRFSPYISKKYISLQISTNNTFHMINNN